MKIIFLDIDGVLNYHDCWARRENVGRGTSVWDNECIAQLNRIIKETSAKIVVSSTWRIHEESYKQVTDKMGIEGEFLGKTSHTLWRKMDNCQRGDEIGEWLKDHQDLNIEKFVILDDDSDMSYLIDHLVQTEFMGKGLTKELADEAIKMLMEP